LHGAPEGIRTPGPLLRRQLLYPTELQAQIKKLLNKIIVQNKFELKLYEFRRISVKDRRQFTKFVYHIVGI
jgi:hypothetical protein